MLIEFNKDEFTKIIAEGLIKLGHVPEDFRTDETFKYVYGIKVNGNVIKEKDITLAIEKVVRPKEPEPIPETQPYKPGDFIEPEVDK